MVAIKLVYGDDIRRLELSANGVNQLSTLNSKVHEFYGIEKDSIVLKFKDDDGDLVTISNEDDAYYVVNRFDSLGRDSRAPLQKLGGAKIWVSVKAKSNVPTQPSVPSSAPPAPTAPLQPSAPSVPVPPPAPAPYADVQEKKPPTATGSSSTSSNRAPVERRPIASYTPSNSSTPALDLELKLVSPYHPHELLLTNTPYGRNGFICDNCNRAGDYSTASWHCSLCHFDLCNKCAQPQLPEKKNDTESKQVESTEGQPKQESKESKKEKLLDDLLPFLLSFVSSANIQQAIPIALSVGIDAYLTGADISTVINTMIATSDDIKQHPLTAKLLNILPQYIDRVERIASNIRVYARTIDPQMVGLAKTLIPVFVPQVLANIEAAIKQIIEQRKNGGYSREGFYSAFQPVISRLPVFMHGVFGNVFAQATAASAPPQQSEQQSQPHVGANQTSAQADNASASGNTSVPPNVNNASSLADGINQLLENVINPFGSSGEWQRCLAELSQQIGNINVNVNDDGSNESGTSTAQPQIHRNIECDGCGAFPITGRRFQCNECRDFDFCESCYSAHSDIHEPTHTFKEIKIDGNSCGDRHWRRGGGGRCGRRRVFEQMFGTGVAGSGDSEELPFGWRHHRGRHGSHSRGRGRHHHHRHGDRESSPTPPPHHFPHPPFFGGGPPPAPFLPWFGGMAASSGNNTPTAQSRPQAVFIKDVNLSDRSEVETNSTVIKTWSIKNPSSTQSWPEGTRLIVVRGDYELASQEEFPVPLAKAGETVEVSAVLNVPEKHGRYSVYFRLADGDRSVFGPRIWCDIIAVQPEVKATPSAPASAVNQETQTSNIPTQQNSTQTPVNTVANTRHDVEMSADADDINVDEAALIAEAVNSTTLPTANVQGIGYPVLHESTSNGGNVASSTRSLSSASSSSNGSQKWNVVIEDDIESEDEKYESVAEKKPLIEKTQTPAAQQSNTTVESTQSHRPVSPSPSAASNSTSTSTSSSAQQYASELATLNELGFTNQALNLFLLKQQQGNVKKVVEWLVERLQ